MDKRKVKRPAGSTRQQIVKRYNTRAWYQLPDWAQQFVVSAAPWFTGLIVAVLTPAAALALVLGFHSLPLEIIGVPGTENDFGLAAFILLVKVALLALALKPLYRRQAKGWTYLILASFVHLLHSIWLQHPVSGTLICLGTLYLYSQVRRWYTQ